MNTSSNQGPIRGADLDAYNKFLGTAQQQNTDYFAPMQRYTGAELANKINTQTGLYNTDTAETQNQYQKALREQADTEGQQGTYRSSARQLRLNSLANTYGNQLNRLYTGTQGQNYADLLKGEYTLGAGSMYNQPTQGLTRYSTSLNPNQPGTVNPVIQSQGARYNPFGFIGRNQVDYNVANVTNANDLFGRAYPNRRIQ